jgi:hypothetical protein
VSHLPPFLPLFPLDTDWEGQRKEGKPILSERGVRPRDALSVPVRLPNARQLESATAEHEDSSVEAYQRPTGPGTASRPDAKL